MRDKLGDLPNPPQSQSREEAFDTEDVPQFSTTIEDMDRAVHYELSEAMNVNVQQGGQRVEVPLIWDTPEKWAWARKQNHLKTVKEKVLLPLMVLERTGYGHRDSMPTKPGDTRFTPRGREITVRNRHSPRNRYDRFSAQHPQRAPEKEYLTVSVPRYISVDYELTIYTEYLWQMDRVSDLLLYKKSSHWGTEDRLYYVTYDQISTDTQSSEEARYVEAQLSFSAYGYIVPETEPVEKTFTFSSVSFEESIDTS